MFLTLKKDMIFSFILLSPFNFLMATSMTVPFSLSSRPRQTSPNSPSAHSLMFVTNRVKTISKSVIFSAKETSSAVSFPQPEQISYQRPTRVYSIHHIVGFRQKKNVFSTSNISQLLDAVVQEKVGGTVDRFSQT